MIIGFVTNAFVFVFGTIFRGIATILVMGLGAYLWRRISLCRGRFIVRPATLLFFPVVAIFLACLYAPLFTLKLVLSFNLFSVAWAGVLALAAAASGVLAGLAVGKRTHVYATRWGRILMLSSGRHLDLWFGTAILAAFFMLLPFGWLASPTMALFLFGTLLVVVAQGVLYARFKQLEAGVYKEVPGTPIDLSLSPPEAAVVACLMNLWARTGGAGVPLPDLVAALRAGDRLRRDVAVALLPSVRRALADLAARPDAVGPLAHALTSRGVLGAGLVPGSMLGRLLSMGGMARTVSFGGGPMVGGRGVREAVVAQAGGTNLLFEASREKVSLREVGADEMLAAVGAVIAAS